MLIVQNNCPICGTPMRQCGISEGNHMWSWETCSCGYETERIENIITTTVTPNSTQMIFKNGSQIEHVPSKDKSKKSKKHK